MQIFNIIIMKPMAAYIIEPCKAAQPFDTWKIKGLNFNAACIYKFINTLFNISFLIYKIISL